MFTLETAKDANIPLGGHFKLSSDLCSSIDLEKEDMLYVPHSNSIRFVMYTMICTRPDLSYVITVLSRYMSNLGKTHW